MFVSLLNSDERKYVECIWQSVRYTIIVPFFS